MKNLVIYYLLFTIYYLLFVVSPPGGLIPRDCPVPTASAVGYYVSPCSTARWGVSSYGIHQLNGK